MSVTQIRGNTQIIDNTINNAKILNLTIDNTKISATAAIAYSKLSLTGSIVNADINAAAAIAYSKLASLGGSTNAVLIQDGSGHVSASSILSGNLFLADGSVSLTGSLNANSHKLINVTDPTAAQDAATMNYVDTSSANTNYLHTNGSVSATGDLNMGSHKITSLSDPIADQDAATKAYVDSVAAGLDVKSAVRVATTTNLNATAAGSGIGKTLTNAGTQVALVIDGVTMAVNDRVLVKNQSTAKDNGIYIVTNIGSGSTNWVLTRATDFDGSPANEVAGGDFTFVELGTQSASGWTVINDGNIVVDTDPINWTQFNASVAYTADETTLHLSGTTFSVKTGGITDTQVSASAAIAYSKLALSGSIVNSDISATAAIAFSKLASLATGHILAGNAGVVTDVTLSGDATINGSGVLTLTATALGSSHFVTREVPTGTIDGSNVTFTLANTPISGSEEVFVNGILQNVGGGNDYTISGATITFNTAPQTGDIVLVNSRK